MAIVGSAAIITEIPAEPGVAAMTRPLQERGEARSGWHACRMRHASGCMVYYTLVITQCRITSWIS